MIKHSNFSALALASAISLVALSANAQVRSDEHDGIRRWTGGLTGSVMYAPNGASFATLGGRATRQVHAYFDFDVAAGWLHMLEDVNQNRDGFYIEAGPTVSAHLGTPYARVGAFTTLGAASNIDTWMLGFSAGVELRFGTSFQRQGVYGLDGRLRALTRVVQGLNQDAPLNAAYGIELAFAFGGGGDRVIRSHARDEYVAEHMATLVSRDYQDMTTEERRRAFPVCRASLFGRESDIPVDARTQDDDEHACFADSGSLVAHIPANECALYIASHPVDDGAELSSGAQLIAYTVPRQPCPAPGQACPPLPPIPQPVEFSRSFVDEHGMALLFACSTSELSVRGRLTEGDRDLPSFIARVPLNLPPGVGGGIAPLPAPGPLDLNGNAPNFLGMTTVSPTWQVPPGHAWNVCVYAPQAAQMRVEFSPAAAPSGERPAADRTQSEAPQPNLTWDGKKNGLCHGFDGTQGAQMIRLIRTRENDMRPWPVAITFRELR